MRKYYDRSATPLTFHKFFWWVILPVNFIFGVVEYVRFVLNIGWIFSHGLFGMVYIVYLIVVFELSVACFVGFFQWRSYAWYCVVIYLPAYFLFNLYVVSLSVIFLRFESAAVVGLFIGTLIYSILAEIYYIKRRPLFFQETGNIHAAARGSGKVVQASEAGTADPLPQAKYCSQCGAALPERSDFCSECGTPVQKS